MECLLIFDNLNDIIYTKYNKKFIEHITEFAVSQGLQAEPSNNYIDGDVMVQIFSPIITSHRIMSCQFGNTYTSIQCDEGLNIYFDEYMGYLFITIGNYEVSVMKRYINVCITVVRYLCGPDVYQLKENPVKCDLATKLIDSWVLLYEHDQAIRMEAIEQLIVNSDLSSASIKALSSSVDKLAPQIECNKIHALLLVQTKFLSLYSSQNAKELSATDILFIMILCQSTYRYLDENAPTNLDISSYQILLSGPQVQPKCLPHVVHIIPITTGVYLIYLLQVGNAAVASSLYETFCHLHTMQAVQVQRDKIVMQPALENLEIATKKLNDSLKKNKNSKIEVTHKQIMKKWGDIRKKYQEYLKNSSDGALLRAETMALGLMEDLKDLLKLTSIDDSIIRSSEKYVLAASEIVKDQLENFVEFLTVKSIRNFSLGSDSLTMNKYLEEFPGLVHFIYVDRTNHRMTAPTLDENMFNKKKIWQMISFARNHLQEGNLSLIWKDVSFSYAYFMWFEDPSGLPIKPTLVSTTNLPLPGILCDNFYQKLTELYFPKTAPNKIRCYELFCIHLGLITTSCILEQIKRLSATIWELKGHPSHPIDLL